MMSNQPKNSAFWGLDLSDHAMNFGQNNDLPLDSAIFHDGSSMWPNNFPLDGSNFAQDSPKRPSNCSTVPDLPSLWSKYSEESNLVSEFSNWSVDPLRSRIQNFPWDESVPTASSNLPQPNPNDVPGNDVFQNTWSTESAHAASDSHREYWTFNSAFTPVANSSSQEVVVQSSDSHIITTAIITTTTTTTTTQGQTPEFESLIDSTTFQNERPVTPISVSKLVEERINNPTKWGQRPVKQSTPWHIEQEDCDSLKSNRQRKESNVWRSEPPTGAQVWDSLHLGHSTAPAASSNGSVISRISPQTSSTSQPVAFNCNSNPWNYSTGPFSSRPQFSPQVSSVFGAPSAIRRQVHGTGSSASRHSNENIGPGQLGSRLNVWPAYNEMANNKLSNRQNNWAPMAFRSAVDSQAGNFLEGPNRNSNINGVPTTLQAMSSHRNSLLNYFMQLGFPRGDVEDVLSTDIIDIDQCLARLRSLQSAGFSGRLAPRTVTDSRLLSSPTASFDSGPHFGLLLNSQNTSKVPFGRGNMSRPMTSARANSMSQFGVAGPNNACTGGDDLTNVSLSSLLGRPPAQPSMQSTPIRHFHSQAQVQYVEELLAKKSAIQFQLNEFKDKPFMFASVSGRTWFNELNLQLQQVNMQLVSVSSSGASGVLGLSSSANGFRSSRHNSCADTFGSQGSSSGSEENWLFIRDMPTSMSKLALERLLKCNILELHDFPGSGNYLLRLASAEVAREVKQRCDTQIVSVTPNVIIISTEVATGFLIEAAKLKNPVAAAAAFG